MSFGVSLSFDVDGEAGLACRPGSGWALRLSSRSEARFGVLRGLPRILGVLAEHAARATFYVPGTVAQAEPAAVREIAAAGHEIAHHGHAHLPSHRIGEREQRDEIERGLAALTDCVGTRPVGYRSPAWELTPFTLGLLAEHGFLYDSSLMGDDRPYRLANGLLELPVHWSLDDVPYLAFDPDRPTRLGHHAGLLAAWTAEHDSARAEDRHLTLTMHPEITGRGARLDLLRGLLERIDAPPLTHRDAAR